MFYYEVAPLKLVRAEATVFTYHSERELAPGTIVTVPVGKQELTGVVMQGCDKPTFSTKAISRVVTERPLPAALLATASWMATYYSTHLSQVLTTLLPRGLTKQRRARPPQPEPARVRHDNTHVSTPEQQQAIDAINGGSSTTYLLHGVTGSGKTHVYIEATRRVLEAGHSAIILVPEISLTPQLVDEFQQQFPGRIIVSHSHQTEAERHVAWLEALQADEPKIVIGPRSALFLPLPSVGLICVDECHEPSYKQEQSPRYSALRVATVLAKSHHGKVVFGSATPPVSEYYTALEKAAPIIRLAHSARDATPATVQLINSKDRQAFLGNRLFSDALLSRMKQSLDHGQQVLLFHNRRGTAPTTLCNNCGWTALDPTTETPLTLHADTHQLVSHITGYTIPVMTSCPVCHHADIIHKGLGTKRIETEIARLFPNKKIVRFDSDTLLENRLERTYDALYSGDVDIIIGTQTVAKGIDLPRLTTVGVLQADAGLSLPDYTSSERVFQLLSQVIGRVGRAQTPSTVIVQTYQPDHYAITTGLAQDYHSFYEQEIALRKAHSFPPFTYLLKIVCTYKTEAIAIKHITGLKAALQKSRYEVTFFGPGPAFYARSSQGYRWQLIVKSPRRHDLAAIAQALPQNSHWQHEIDPVSLLS